MNIAKLNILLLIVGAAWLLVSVVFFVLHFAGTGMLPLSLPVATLVLSAVFFAAYFYIRKMTADRKK